MGMAILCCKCLFCYSVCYIGAQQFTEGHLMGVSLCSVLDDCLKKSFLFCSIEVLVYQL